MQSRLRSVEWYKGFEAIRDKSGLCVDKHYCLGTSVALREFCFYDERQTHFRSNMLVALMPVMPAMLCRNASKQSPTDGLSNSVILQLQAVSHGNLRQ